MFRYTKLILAVILTGCTTQAGENIATPYTPEPPPFKPNIGLLQTIEATLDVADEAIDEIIKDKIITQNKISNLQNTVNYEEGLLTNLSGELIVRDSLIMQYKENSLILKEEIHKVEDDLNHAKHNCKTQCYPTIIRLNQENQDLLYSIDSLQTWVFYLDSLILTNKRLSKKSTFPH